jgi:DNA-binding GntR family transcriptional regulator
VTTSDHRLAPARRRVLADEVADTIREAIFSGRIDLGQRLIEEDLATMLNVSRGPVREALAHLTQEGLTKVERHRGTTVAPLSVDELHEIYSLRSALESLAADWVCRRTSHTLRACSTDLTRCRPRSPALRLPPWTWSSTTRSFWPPTTSACTGHGAVFVHRYFCTSSIGARSGWISP